jgi:two-component system response regulator FixJ
MKAGGIRVYIVDDDAKIRTMVGRMLACAGRESQEFASATAFLQALPTLPPGCVLLDINMPDESGLAVLTRLERLPLPVIMVSGSPDVGDAITAFRRGAVHFVRKPFRRAALLDALTEAQAVLSARQAEIARRAAAERIHLTPREREVLGAMAEGRQSKAIAWQLGLSIRTVEMHRSNLLAKFGATNATQAVATARMLDLLPQAVAAAA